MTTFWNNTKTALLLGLMFGLILFAGSLFGRGGLMIAFLLGGGMTLVYYFKGASLAIAAMKAKEVDESSAPDLVDMVQRLADRAGVPMPRVYISPQQAPNAFAAGRNPRDGAVVVTQGILRLLSYEELEGVIAHELAHIKNRDTLISTIAAMIAGTLTYLGYFGMFFGGRDNPLGAIGMILMIFLAPIAAALIQMAISRSREYVADAQGAEIAGSPNGLMNALRKLDSMNKRVPMENEMPSQNHMFIVQPLSGGGGLSSLFSTHPATEDRIAKLRELA